MLYIESFTFNPFDENTYLIFNDHKECWIIDPGMYTSQEAQSFQEQWEKRGLQPKAIINTHAHIDHIFGIPFLLSKHKIPFFLHEREIPLLEAAPQIAQAYGLDNRSYPMADSVLTDAAHELVLGEDKITCLPTPGHSPGSLSFYYAPGEWVISGDALFAGSIGRTDLPGGNHDQLIQSIKTQLLTLPGSTRVWPGHGPSTNIDQEVQSNPYLR